MNFAPASDTKLRAGTPEIRREAEQVSERGRTNQTPLQRPAHFAPEDIDNVLHFADAQKKRRAEKCSAGKRNRREEYRQFLQEPHVRPRIEPPMIRRPTNERQQRTGHTNFSKRDQHLARFKPARVPAHQRVEQKKIDRGDEAR